ncbi:MAG: hypothetical protein JSV86_09035 [Gemmatimonadota bacterium]|nr:MAG: hypothetical protein JSV86_09035 [Gemmatimonadota bacterium]
MNMRSLLTLFAAAMPLASCGGDALPALSGDWRATQIEWTQSDQRVRLTAAGEMHVGRLRLPQRPGSFDTMIEAMATLTIEVRQSGRDLSGDVRAGPDAPASLLRQVGAQPGSVVAEFDGALVNDTLAAVVLTTPDGQRRDIVLRIEERGRRVIARAVPVFGESVEDAGDVVLVPAG